MCLSSSFLIINNSYSFIKNYNDDAVMMMLLVVLTSCWRLRWYNTNTDYDDVDDGGGCDDDDQGHTLGGGREDWTRVQMPENSIEMLVFMA